MANAGKFAAHPLWIALRLGSCLLAGAATAQDAQPPLPGVSPPPESVPPAAGSDLESRLRQAEQANRKLAEQLEESQRRHDAQIEALLRELSELRRQIQAPAATPGPADRPLFGAPASAGNVMRPSDRGLGGARPEGPRPGYVISGTATERKFPLQASFGPGFELMTDDGEYQLQIHQETQVDFKEFDPNGDEFARSGLVLPRVRVFFNGRVSKNYDYMVSINRGFGGLDVLDAFVNFHPGDRFQVKVGRFMSPFNYEQYAIQNMWLLAPERSLFTANLGLNRMPGAMAWGTVFDKRLDYSFGVFNGPRNTFVDYNESKDVMAYLNARPWGDRESHPLRSFNFGGSFTYGAQDNPLIPRAFRTASNQSNASDADLFSPPFFIFNHGVVERGQRAFWSAHTAYFYKSLSLFADYNGGILRYARNVREPASVDIPSYGFSMGAGYFLTGESLERRTIVDPLRPFSLKHGAFAPGAWELVARYSLMHLDSDVFDQNLSDPKDWTNRAWIFNLGANWYLNRYVLLRLYWQHTEFGSPVLYREPDLRQLTNELLWLRLQIYF